MEAQKKILLIAGEASGDHHGALVVRALKEIDNSVRVYGIGGDDLSRAGMELLCHSRDLSVVGISEVFSQAGHIFKAFRSIKKEIRESPPDLVVLIDYPDFNLRIAGIAKKNGVPVLYYISPQIWAWRKRRAKKISGLVDKMAVIFQFEVPLYEKEELDVSFVGHPLLDQDIVLKNRADALSSFNMKEGWPVIGLLPGSRLSEIERLLPAMLDSSGLICNEFPSAVFVLPLAPGINESFVQTLIDQKKSPVQIVRGNFYQVLDVCDLVLVASGTATLEAAVMEKPMVIIYRLSLLSYLIGRMLINVSCIGLANIVAGKQIVPELIQAEVTPERIADEALRMLKDKKLIKDVKAELGKIKKALGTRGASQRVARLAYEMIMRHG